MKKSIALALALTPFLSHSEEVNVRWNCNSQCDKVSGYQLNYGMKVEEMVQTLDFPPTTLSTVVKNLSPGRWYFQIFQRGEGNSVRGSAIVSALSEGAPPQGKHLIASVGSPVYNTGSFDPSSWQVKRNKLLGTLISEAACDVTRPAVGGYYRVPVTAVKWASTGRTSYPLAKCEWR